MVDPQEVKLIVCRMDLYHSLGWPTPESGCSDGDEVYGQQFRPGSLEDWQAEGQPKGCWEETPIN